MAWHANLPKHFSEACLKWEVRLHVLGEQHLPCLSVKGIRMEMPGEKSPGSSFVPSLGS